jgi:hypothetical protein
MKKLLLRQVHPTHLNNGLSSGAFRPTPNDGDQLSVDCGNMTDPKASYELHISKTRVLPNGDRVHLETAGTWAISREICTAEKLTVLPDAISSDGEQPENSAHHLVDFSSIEGIPKKKNDTVAKRLRQNALVHGQLWPTES